MLALTSALLTLLMPLQGDDLIFSRSVAQTGWKWMPIHWLTTNGRLADILGPALLLNLPAWIRALLDAIATAALYLLMVRAAGFTFRRNALQALTIMLAGVALLPWWDSMFLMVCRFSYPWATALAMLFLFVFFRAKPPTGSLAGFLLGWLAGGCHEACGLPLLAGAAAAFCMPLFRRDRLRKAMLGGLIAGTATVVCSPALWQRFGSDAQPDDSPAMLALKSVPAVLLLALTLVALLLFRKKTICRIFSNPATTCAIVASMAGAAIALRSGVVGRSGFFAGAFAIVALGRIWRICCGEISGHLSLTLMAMLLIEMHCGATVTDAILYRSDFRQFDQLYSQSNDGVVMMNPRSDRSAAIFALRRVRGVPDADDVWLRKALSIASGKPAPIIVPNELATAGSLPLAAPDGRIVDRLSNVVIPTVQVVSDGIVFEMDSSKRFVVERFVWHGDSLVMLTPLTPDPGDRIHDLRTRSIKGSKYVITSCLVTYIGSGV